MSKHFLIVKTSAIGDIIQSFPVIEYLREKFPGCAIDWALEKRYEDLLTAHPFVRQVFTMDSYHLRKKWYHPSTLKELFAFRRKLQGFSYDAIFDLQGNAKSALITSFAKGSAKIGFGWKSVPEKLNLLVTSHRFNVSESVNIQKRYLSLVQSYFQDAGSFTPQGVTLHLSPKEEDTLSHFNFDHHMNIMVAFGSKWENKQLSPDTLIKFLQKIDHNYKPYFFFVWGSIKEKEEAERLTHLFPERSCMLGNLSFALWQGIMCRMHSVIAMDSAALHLSGTTDTPSFSVFGPSASSVYKPLGSQHAHIQGACPYNEKFIQRCPILRTCKTGACMKNLQAEELFKQYASTNYHRVRSPSQ